MCYEHLTEEENKRNKPERPSHCTYYTILGLAIIITFPLALVAFLIDIVNIFTKKENNIDESYHFIYIDEVGKYVKELLCSPFI